MEQGLSVDEEHPEVEVQLFSDSKETERNDKSASDNNNIEAEES